MRARDLPLTAVEGDDDLHIGGCSVRMLAARFGTPLYLVDAVDVRARADAYVAALARLDRPVRCVFASKALPVIGVLSLIGQRGIGADVASGGELAMALSAGLEGSRLISHGNARTMGELRAAVEAGVALFVLDGPDDVDRLDQVAITDTDVLVRVAPGIPPATHLAMATSHVGQKFGVTMEDAPTLVAAVRNSRRLRFRGYHVHVGSQVCALDPFVEAVARLATLGPMQVLDVGGGLGIPMHATQRTPSIAEWVAAVGHAMAVQCGPATELIVEPGRSLVGLAGVTVHTVQTVKHTGGRTFVAIDGGTSDNLEAVQGARQQRALVLPARGAAATVDIVGMHCDSGDVIAKDVEITDASSGDLIVTTATGAYAHATASNYNAVLRPPVLLLEDGSVDVLVERETFDDLLRRQRPG